MIFDFMLDLLYNLFWGWDGLDFLVLGLVLYACYCWGYKKATQQANKPRRYPRYTSAQQAPTSYNADDYKSPAILRRQGDNQE